MKTAPAIGFHCRASRSLLIAMLGVSGLALLAVWLSATPDWLHVLLSLLVVAWAGVAASHLLRPRVTALLWRAAGGVDLTLGHSNDRREAQGAIVAARVLGPLIVLTLRWPPRERVHLWLLPDNLDADTRRRLRVRLSAGSFDGLPSGNADSA